MLEKLPKAKTKCRSCGKPIHVASGPDQKRHLLREDELGAFAARSTGLIEGWDQEERAALLAAGFLYGDWAIEVVGESYRQPALADLAARGRQHAALLAREPDNPHDANAVRVDIAGFPVGYLSRDSALDAQMLLEHLQRQGLHAWVRAVIDGGDGRAFGVTLDGLPDDDEWQG
jgi:hypothetical protein